MFLTTFTLVLLPTLYAWLEESLLKKVEKRQAEKKKIAEAVS